MSYHACSNQICSLSTHWVCKWLLIISGHLHRLLSLYCFPPKYPCFPLLPLFPCFQFLFPTSWWTQLTCVTARYAIKSLWYWKTMCCKHTVANWNQDISCDVHISQLLAWEKHSASVFLNCIPNSTTQLTRRQGGWHGTCEQRASDTNTTCHVLDVTIL